MFEVANSQVARMICL